MAPSELKFGQLYALRELCSKAAGSSGHAERVWLLSRLLGREVTTSNEVTHREWQALRDEAYPCWPENDWTMSDKFIAKGRAIMRKYAESIGQLVLPL
jgi:hypothetical protein